MAEPAVVAEGPVVNNDNTLCFVARPVLHLFAHRADGSYQRLYRTEDHQTAVCKWFGHQGEVVILCKEM